MENILKVIKRNNNIITASIPSFENLGIHDKIFKDCKDKSYLPFDFYLSDYNLLIEYDGEQHFHPVEKFRGEEGFKKTQYHDRIKTEYAKDNNIKLLRITYLEQKNIEEILKKTLN